MGDILGAFSVGDIFSGIGCASWAFKKQGFVPKFAVDNDPERSLIYESNVGLKPVVADVREVGGAMLLSRAGIKKGELDVLVGCPPCQSFSSLSKTRGVEPSKDRRSSLLLEFVRLVEEILPRSVVFENVLGLTKPRAREFLDGYLEALHNLGYETTQGVLNAAGFGVPQIRKRVFAVSVRKSESKAGPSLPDPTHFDDKVPRWETVRRTIGDLPPLEAGERNPHDSFHWASFHSPTTLKIIKAIPPDGGSRRSLPPELVLPCHEHLKHGANSVYGRLWWDRPATTITTVCIRPSCGRFIHPEQNRGITLREAARLQSIPDDFYLGESLSGRRDRVAAMIGDAVPPRLMTAVASHIANLLN